MYNMHAVAHAPCLMFMDDMCIHVWHIYMYMYAFDYVLCMLCVEPTGIIVCVEPTDIYMYTICICCV